MFSKSSENTGAEIHNRNSNVEEEDTQMTRVEAHIVLHCLVFPLVEVGGDQADGHAGQAGEEEVQAKGFANLLCF